jgi:hypothetical protein
MLLRVIVAATDADCRLEAPTGRLFGERFTRFCVDVDGAMVSGTPSCRSTARPHCLVTIVW